MEELGIVAKIGPLVHTQEIISEDRSVFDFWYWIENAEDFLTVDLSKASHGFEHSEVGFYDLEMLGDNFKPVSLKKLQKIWETEGVRFIEQEQE